jgi:hypothetical protein
VEEDVVYHPKGAKKQALPQCEYPKWSMKRVIIP